MADAIVPDDKDWTWVLEQPCRECRFDAGAIDVLTVGGILRENAAAWADLLQGPAEDLRRRPVVDRWSPLEYSAHVRDVFRLFLTRLRQMLHEDDPVFANWDQDATALTERYNEQDPAVVAVDVVAAGTELADAFDAVTGEQWQRTGRRSDGAAFTIDSFARYLVHDPVHHLWDVRRPTKRPT